jgi:hypothetical protein
MPSLTFQGCGVNYINERDVERLNPIRRGRIETDALLYWSAPALILPSVGQMEERNMERTKKAALVVGIVLLMVGMSFATMVGGADDGLEPTVTKTVDPDMIWFGSTETKSTVTIEVTGDGGTSTSITPIDVVFAIDASGSMTVNDPSDLRLAAAKYFVDQLDDSRDTGGVVSWSSAVVFTYGLSDDFTTLKDKIDLVGHSGGTNLNAGLTGANTMLSSTGQVGSTKVIIFLTDGVGTYTYYSGGAAPVDVAAAAGYTIFSIALGNAATGPLEDMADNTGGAFYSAPTASNLQDIYDDIYTEILTSISLYDVQVTEIVQDYFTVCYDTIDPVPDSFTVNGDGTTTIVWNNVGQYAGDLDNALTADETAVLEFMVKATKAGFELPVQVLPGANVKYWDVDGNYLDSTPIPQDYISVGYSTDLIAGGGNANSEIVVGEVLIWQDEDNVYVKFVTTGDWYMTLTHVHVADDWTDIPQTKKGNPIPGQFDYSMSHDPPVQSAMYTIPWDESWDGTIYVAAHANVQMLLGYDSEGNPIYQTETAWGDGTDFPGNNWGTYIEYVDP